MADDVRGNAGRELGDEELDDERRPKPVDPPLRGVARILGSSLAIHELRTAIADLAPYPWSCVLTGETGAGKDVAAHALHEESGVAGPFIAVNCANLSGELVEDKLFGHERGAFTGAHKQFAGCFERAAEGTLLLDEANELPLATQAKLLRVLEEGWFERLGGHTPVKAKGRVVVACQRSLEDEAAAGRFREDLFYRVAVVEIPVRPLRARLEDVPELVVHLARLYGIFVEPPPREALELLLGWHWPGNVRELDRIVKRVILLARARAGTRLAMSRELVARAMGTLRRVELPHALPWAARLPSIADARGLVEVEERKLLVAVVEEAGGDLERASTRIGWDRRKLVRRLDRDPPNSSRDSVAEAGMPAREGHHHASSIA